MTRPTPLAIERLTEFTDGDRQLERELSSLYLSTATLYVDEMRANLANTEEWRRTAHALKGASANIGATEVARLAKEAEQAGPSPALLASLEDALEEVRRFFRERSQGWPLRFEPVLASSR
jgi:HPt (histidine-containing phosphotransfer) domain-containing protein